MTLEEFKKKKKDGSLINARSAQSQSSTSTKMSFEEFKTKKQNGTLLNSPKASEVANVKEEQPQIKASDVRKININDIAEQSRGGITSAQIRHQANLMQQQKALEKQQEQERWNNLSLGEKIADPFKTAGANIKFGDLGIEENIAWNEYRNKQDEESLKKAQEATKAREEYQLNNDRIGKGNAVTKDFAQYLPQLGGQLKSGIGGALGGAGAGALGGAGVAFAAGQLGPQVVVPEEIATVPAGALTGAIWGGKTGYVAGTAKYGYDMMAGSAYKTLLDMGVPNDIALELSGDEALISSLIEGGGAIVDLITLGIGKLGSKGATTAGKELAKNRLLAAAKAYGVNLISEPLEEMAQEKVSIETEKKAAEKTGIERTATDSEDWQRIKDAGETALKVAAVSGGLNAGGNYLYNTVGENLTTNKDTMKLKEIDSKTLSQLEDINNQKFQNVDTETNNLPKMDTATEKQLKLLKNVPQNGPQNVPSQQINTTLPTQAEMAQKTNTEQIDDVAKMVTKNDNFHKGLEKFNSKKYTQTDDMVVLDETPQYLYNLGFDADKPLVINMSKLETIMKEPKGTFDGKNQHGITMDVVEQLPKALQNPLNVIKNPKHNERVVVVTELTDQYGDIIIVPIEMNTDGYIENIENDVNRINTVYGKENYDIPKEGNDKGYIQYNEDKIIYDIDKDITKKRDINSDYRLQLPSTAINISNNSINLNDNSVNKEYAQTKQNDTADKQSAFSMPKNEVQTFASSTAPRPYMDLNRYTSRNNDSKTEKVGLTDIQNAINDIVTVKTGKFRQQAYGIYKTNNEIIRLKEAKDIPVALHELTHHLDKKYNLSSSDKAFKELENIAVVGKNASKQTIISEGVAEFGRYYMTNKDYAKEIAPFYYDAFERALDNDSDMKSKVDNIRQMVSDYLEQSPLNRLSSNIDYGDSDMSLWEKGKESIVKTAKNFRKNFVDELDPLKKIVEEISSGDKLMTKENAYKLLRLNNGVTGKVQVALEYGVLNKNGEKVGKSLKEILEPVASQQKEFVAYVTALRAKDLQGRGIESGMLSKDVNDVINSYNTNATFNLAAKELYEFQNKILETTLINSGIITREALEAYNKNNPHYVPFYRVMDENFKQSKSSKSKTPKRIKGSTRDIINPLESIIKNTYSYMQMAERNDAFKTLFDMANKYDGTGKWFDKVPTDMIGTKITAEDVKGILEQLNLSEEDVNYNEIFTTIFKPANNQKGNIVTVMEKGEPVHYEINDKELFDILSPTGKGENIIVKLLSPASKALRVGATHTPEFVLRNPLRDTIDAGIYSKNGFIPFVDTIKGIFDVVGRSDLYYRWLQSGGSGSTYTNAQRPVLQKTLKGLTEETTNEKNIKEALKGAVELIKHPLRTYLDVAGTISNVAEEATRLGEFRRALEKGKGEKTAALDSREITLDFSRGGKVAKDINKVVAFFNAELQGLDKMFNSFKEKPLATTVKGLAYLTIPAMILRALQDEEKLDKVPQWEKDEYFIIFAGDTPIKIPKPQGLGQLFATFPERIIDFIRTQDKDAFDGFAQRLIASYVPIDSTTSIFPNFFLPLIENSANYSFFRQQPVVKQSLQNRSPRYQYDENTSTIAKKVGEITNTSPKKIDNLISGYFGNLGKDIVNIAGVPFDIYDSINGKNKGEKEYQSLNSTLKKIPVVKGFIASDTSSKAVDKFYEGKEKASADYADAKFKYSETKMTAKQEKELEYLKSVNSLYNKAYNDMKDIEEQIDDVKTSNRSNEYKKTMLDKLQKQKNKIAEDTKKELDKLKAKNTLITQAEQRAKLKK